MILFFEYSIRKSKGKYLRIVVKPGGYVEVFKPNFYPMFLVKSFLKQKEQWILKKIEKQKQVQPTANKVSKKDSRLEYLKNREPARLLVLEKLDFWRDFYQTNFQINFDWKQVTIKNSKTRWGSCSSRKNLNFSYRIVFLKKELQDYLVIHELCHLLQMNHSKAFWCLVGFGLPNYKRLKGELKKYNLQLS